MATKSQINTFIKKIGPLASADQKVSGILASITIAQACLESAYGTSDLAVKAKALFGIKKHDWKGKTYIKKSYEYEHGKKVLRKSVFRAYNSWQESINDHSNYLRTRKVDGKNLTYKAVVGEKDYKKAAKALQKAGYSTYGTYASMLINLIEKYKLTQYDLKTNAQPAPAKKATPAKTPTEVRIFLDAGHGGKDSGAVLGSRKEKDDVLKLVLAIGKKLTAAGYTVGYSRKTDIYESPTKKAADSDAFKADYFFSFHRNCYNKSAKGYETLYYNHSSFKDAFMKAIRTKMKSIGFTLRQDKQRTNLTVLKKTEAPALLFEVGFIDISGDNKIFDKKFDQIVQAYVDVIKAQCPLAKKSNAEKYLEYLQTYNEYIKAHGKYFFRSWDAHESTFAKAKAKVNAGQKTGLTCVVPVRWGLKDMGIDPTGFCVQNGRFVGYDADMKAKLTKYTEGKFIGHTLKYCVDNKLLKKGDIIAYRDTTHVFAYSGTGYMVYDGGSAAEKQGYKNGILLDDSKVNPKKLVSGVLRWK